MDHRRDVERDCAPMGSVVLMRRTCWVAEATTGDVIGKLNEVQLTQMTKSLTGGKLAGSTHLDGRRDDLDWPSLIADRAMLAPLPAARLLAGLCGRWFRSG